LSAIYSHIVHTHTHTRRFAHTYTHMDIHTHTHTHAHTYLLNWRKARTQNTWQQFLESRIPNENWKETRIRTSTYRKRIWTMLLTKHPTKWTKWYIHTPTSYSFSFGFSSKYSAILIFIVFNFNFNVFVCIVYK